MNKLKAARQDGQVLVVFALVLSLVLFAITTMIADLAILFVHSARVQSAAQLAAIAGAADVDNRQFFSSSGTKVVLDHSKAVPDCQLRGRNFAGNPTATVLCVPGAAPAPPGRTREQITATVSQTITLPIGLFGSTSQVSATYTASPVSGTTTPH